MSGAVLSPDGSNDAVTGPDGNWAVWPPDGSGLHPVPGLDSKYGLVGWSPEGNSGDMDWTKKVYFLRGR